jgi:hypothetical protein
MLLQEAVQNSLQAMAAEKAESPVVDICSP